jgi:hypothetical protein
LHHVISKLRRGFPFAREFLRTVRGDQCEIDDDRNTDGRQRQRQREVHLEAETNEQNGDRLPAHGEPAQQDEGADPDPALGGPESGDRGGGAGVLEGHADTLMRRSRGGAQGCTGKPHQ